MAAWFFYILISSGRIYYALHVAPNQFWLQHAHELAFILQALILALGLADQVLGYKKSYLTEKDKHAKANKALLAESLINNFLYELKDEALKKSKVDNFIKFIENKLTAMLVKYVAVDNIKRLSVKDGVKYTHVFLQQSENDYFQHFYTEYGQEILTACENKTVFSQLVQIESNNKQIQFIVIPVFLNYYNEKVEHECLLFEIEQFYVLNDEEIRNLKNFIEKSLMVLVDRKEINQITKHAQNIISDAAEKDRAMRLKDRFFANVSHEFRTPLTLTIAPLRDLYKQRQFLNTSGKYLVDTALANALELMGLVDKILDIQKLESDTFPLRVSKVNLNDLIYSVIKKLTNWSLDHNQRLTFEKTLNKDIYIYCDLREVRKVIINLISNAIKYSGKDTDIKISLDNDPEWVYVYIKITVLV
jgi:K+-sensing histidine kinase KdpD